MNYLNPAFIIPILCGAVFLLAGGITQEPSSKQINHLFGYRTINSMKSKDRWDLAQQYLSKMMMRLGGLATGFIFFSLFITVDVWTGTLIGLSLLMAIIGILLIKTERMLMMRFGDQKS